MAAPKLRPTKLAFVKNEVSSLDPVNFWTSVGVIGEGGVKLLRPDLPSETAEE
jgi:hypothetical protein